MNDRASRRAPQAGDTELSGPPAAEAIAPQVLRETASWLLLMQEGPLAPAQQAELESWRSRSPEHQRAWRRAIGQRTIAIPDMVAVRGHQV
ncbi:DUF4880 domain-containing protein, partial [Pseudomonas aeruginosa]|uniref:FecR/PupR family sigma factor regulator n=1 Tax=Pseudomonas aeruginosa TaxID=287 RepID=UPI00300B2A32